MERALQVKLLIHYAHDSKHENGREKMPGNDQLFLSGQAKIDGSRKRGGKRERWWRASEISYLQLVSLSSLPNVSHSPFSAGGLGKSK